ncbi:NUDIX hydrolase [Stackebrandtia albiflava]|uniref:NUDIX hydrolase n=1 Tax=Stackebrandtia albiflava TaxID=406432 RepID=UPI0011BF5F7D|nr:NUDIX domain-containing protein [Stackebrandtia albiflava]
MPDATPRVRVAAYVLRRRPDRPTELLVFDHEADLPPGTHVPAGGVALGETLEQAVIREVREETGLHDARIVRILGDDHTVHPIRGFARHTTYLQLTADPATPDAWNHQVTGTGRDEGMTFRCRFVPLPLTFHLADGQDAWLHRLDI